MRTDDIQGQRTSSSFLGESIRSKRTEETSLNMGHRADSLDHSRQNFSMITPTSQGLGSRRIQYNPSMQQQKSPSIQNLRKSNIAMMAGQRLTGQETTPAKIKLSLGNLGLPPQRYENHIRNNSQERREAPQNNYISKASALKRRNPAYDGMGSNRRKQILSTSVDIPQPRRGLANISHVNSGVNTNRIL